MLLKKIFDKKTKYILIIVIIKTNRISYFICMRLRKKNPKKKKEI